MTSEEAVEPMPERAAERIRFAAMALDQAHDQARRAYREMREAWAMTRPHTNADQRTLGACTGLSALVDAIQDEWTEVKSLEGSDMENGWIEPPGGSQ